MAFSSRRSLLLAGCIMPAMKGSSSGYPAAHRRTAPTFREGDQGATALPRMHVGCDRAVEGHVEHVLAAGAIDRVEAVERQPSVASAQVTTCAGTAPSSR